MSIAAFEEDPRNVSEALGLIDYNDGDAWEKYFLTYRRANAFDFVTDQLATGGGVYMPEHAKNLVNAGITHVIDCRIEDKAHDIWKKHRDVAYLWNGYDDDGKPKSAATFQRGLRFGINALDQGGVVYAHCAAGINRGPSMAYALLRAYYGLRPAAAFRAIQGVRPCTAIIYAADVEKALIELGYERS